MRWLQERGVKIWDEWADENGDLGPVYGSQWRSWPDGHGGTIDQIANVVHSIKTKPDSRRHIVTAWNPAEVDEMALPPCHCLFQFYVAEWQAQLPALPALGRRLPRRAVQHRVLCAADADDGAGDRARSRASSSIRSATCTFIRTISSRRSEQLARTPRPLPRLTLNPDGSSIFDFEFEDFMLTGYDPHPHIKAEVAV